MAKWYGLVGAVLWLAATVTLAVAMSWGLVTEPVHLHLADGTPIHGTLYRQQSEQTRFPVVVVLHGIAVARQSCVPGLALPLADNGYLTLAIDLRGQGQSGGSLPRSELDDPMTALNRLADHPEVDAAIDFLKQHPLYMQRHEYLDSQGIALVGHSRGGWAAACVGYRRPDVDSVVSLGAAPGTCDLLRPHNFLILTGGRERLCPVTRCREAITRATAGAVQKPNQPFGEFWEGTCRRLMLVSRVNHFTELADPSISKHVVDWVCASLYIHNVEAPPVRLLVVMAAVLVASVGGLLAVTWALALLHRRLLPGAEEPLRPGSWWRLTVFFVGLLAAVPAVAALSRWVEVGPAYFAGPAVLLLAAVACGCLGSVAVGRQRPGEQPSDAPHLHVLGGLLLGLATLGLAFLWLGLPWSLTWANLMPTPRRLVLGLVLFGLLLPWCLVLAHGWQRLLGSRPSSRWSPLPRGLLWTVTAGVLWFMPQLLAAGHWPLFIVPAGLLATGFAVPLPLWLLPNRPGLSLARAVSHAAGTAWLMACHLPFVHHG